MTGLRDLLPDEDYRFSMRFQRGALSDFFAPGPRHSETLAERARWLDEAPERHAAVTPPGSPLLTEFAAMAGQWCGRPMQDAESFERCVSLGRRLEPDFLLLDRAEDGGVRLVAGCVCFPSSWSLAEKMGHPVEFIHGVVPGLNDQLSRPIHSFLERLQPGVGWRRANWGLSRSPELNQHPDRGLRRLDATVRLDEVWFRVEHQVLAALPATKGVLFGIRIEVHSLVALRHDAEAARGLRRALVTMPEAMAAYKGLATSRASIARLLAE